MFCSSWLIQPLTNERIAINDDNKCSSYPFLVQIRLFYINIIISSCFYYFFFDHYLFFFFADDELSAKLTKEIHWLKSIDTKTDGFENLDIPHEFLCPITHEIMREPVMCSDGYTYEKNAISEWFMSGKSTSPMTNDQLTNTEYRFNHDLRNQIFEFIENKSKETTD